MNEHELFQIGEVAERVGLSLRTLRYYEEVGLVLPSGRSPGGFRLYNEADVERVAFVKQMKPLEFSLDEIRELLAIRDRLHGPDGPSDIERLETLTAAAEARSRALMEHARAASVFAASLRRLRTTAGSSNKRQ